MRISRSLLIVLGAIAIVSVGMYTLTQGRGNNESELNQNRNNQGQIMRGDQFETREPADMRQIRDAIEDTDRAVDRSHWDEATHAVNQIRQRWLSFKPGMRAGAGVHMWPTSDVTQFESVLAQAEGAVSRRDVERAKDALRVLNDLAEKNDNTRDSPSVNE